MFCLDTSSFVAHFAGDNGRDTDVLDVSLRDGTLFISPIVISEVLSDPKLPKNIEEILLNLPVADLVEGFWLRVGRLRKKLLSKKYKARLADCMIAQCCIDHGLILITRDNDFKQIAKVSDLKIF